MFRDRNFDWRRQTHTLTYEKFNHITASGTTLIGLGTGATILSEVSDFGVGGVEMVAGDMVAALEFDLLNKIDLAYDIGVSVLFTADVGTTQSGDAVTWIVLYDQKDVGGALIEAATPLDTVLVEHLEGSTTGYKIMESNRGAIAASKFDATAQDGSISVRVEADAITSYTAGELMFLGLKFDYMPRRITTAGSTEVENEWDAGNIGWGA